jgi:hypothetical protein
MIYLLDLKDDDGEKAMMQYSKCGQTPKHKCSKTSSHIYRPGKCGRFELLFPAEEFSHIQSIPKVGEIAMKQLLHLVRKKYTSM